MVYRRTPRSEKVRAASRSALIGAASRLIQARGYDATTMQEIVSAAGTSIGNAYFYFKNKEELLCELLEIAASENWARTEQLASKIEAGPARVGTMIYANVSTTMGVNRHLARVMLEAEQRVTIVRDIWVAKWQPVLAECFPHLTPEERALAAASIWGANRSLVERVVEGTVKASSEKVVSFAVHWALRGLGVRDAEIGGIIRSARRRVKALHK